MTNFEFLEYLQLKLLIIITLNIINEKCSRFVIEVVMVIILPLKLGLNLFEDVLSTLMIIYYLLSILRTLALFTLERAHHLKYRRFRLFFILAYSILYCGCEIKAARSFAFYSQRLNGIDIFFFCVGVELILFVHVAIKKRNWLLNLRLLLHITIVNYILIKHRLLLFVSWRHLFKYGCFLSFWLLFLIIWRNSSLRSLILRLHVCCLLLFLLFYCSLTIRGLCCLLDELHHLPFLNWFDFFRFVYNW